MQGHGEVVAIYVRPQLSAPVKHVEAARAVPGRGLEGDYYFSGVSRKGFDASREVTLIESEALESIKREYAIVLGDGESRRNIVTRNIVLNHLVGKVFQVGEVTLRGIRLCEPCSHLAALTEKDVVPALLHRGGLRAQILKEGVLRIGDPIFELGAEEEGAENE
jgi:MOSC domain-containing protein YiiM